MNKPIEVPDVKKSFKGMQSTIEPIEDNLPPGTMEGTSKLGDL